VRTTVRDGLGFRHVTYAFGRFHADALMHKRRLLERLAQVKMTLCSPHEQAVDVRAAEVL
jgi:hypothetical protein